MNEEQPPRNLTLSNKGYKIQGNSYFKNTDAKTKLKEL